MPRRVQDIVPNNHRSIRDIPIERNSIAAPIQPPKARANHSILTKKPDIKPRIELKKREEPEEVPEEHEPLEHPKQLTSPRHHKRSRSFKPLILLVSIIVAVAGLGYMASVYFSRAVFSIVPKTVPISVNSTYIAQNTPGKSPLTYEIAAVKGTSSVTVVAADGPLVSTNAQGKVTIYNAYVPQTQRLIAGTRISDDTGRIYRLTSSIVVPGYTTSTAGAKIPGSIVTTVIADKPGQEYNITRNDSITDFKIVAYMGTPRYETMYARINTDIVGGFVGAKKTISPSVLASSTAQAQAQLKATLLAQVADTIPDDYIMYPDAYTTSFSAPQIGGTDPKSATVTVQGTLYGIIFNKKLLVERIAGEEAVATFEEFDFTTPGLESLDFSIANIKDFLAEKKNTLIIKLKGEAQLVGSIPVQDIKTKLAGLSLSDTADVLRSYKPVIDFDKGSGQVIPPWSKVPSNTEHITIEVLTK